MSKKITLIGGGSSALPPAAPLDFRAIQRIDDSARLTWRVAPESRAESIDLFASEKPFTLEDVKNAKTIAQGLAPVDGSRIVPASKATYFAIRINGPDGTRPAFVCKAWEPTAPRVRPDMKFPEKHPYLELTVEDIQAIKQKAAKGDWAAKRYMKGLLSQADAACKQRFVVPPINAGCNPFDRDYLLKHCSATRRLQPIGLAYALSGDEKYATYVRKALLAFADIYPKLPPAGFDGSRVVQNSLFDALWYQPLIIAYDYIYDSPVISSKERAHIENDLLRLACDFFKVDDYATDPRGADLHFKCYNYQAWFIADVGLTGLCLRDPDLLDYAIDSPYGFKHLVTHDIRDDGLFWERSWKYHYFVQTGLMLFLEAAYHCNIDLYHLRVPDSIVKDRENTANYVVDGDNGPKSVKLLYDGPFYYAFPDLTFPVYADSNRRPLPASDLYRIAWLRYRDPKYAWLLQRGAKPPAAWHGPNNASANLWLSWDESNLYVFADVRDNIVRNTRTDPSKWWSGAGIWLGLKFTDRPENAYDFIYFIDPGDFAKAKPVLGLFNRYTKAKSEASAGKLEVKKTAAGYEARAIIPFSEIAPREGETGPALKPKEGMKITFDTCIYDGDLTSGDSRKEKMLGWSSRLDRYDTQEGGVLVFAGVDAKVPDSKGKPIAVAVKRKQPLELGLPADEWKCNGVPITIGDVKDVVFDMIEQSPAKSLFYESPAPGEGHFEIGTGRFANNGVAMRGSTLFPSSGFAILREESPQESARCVALSFGPHGGGHGHPDMLSIVVYAFGRHVIPDFGSCKYGSKEKEEWTSQTVSHNTVVVDGISQYPTGERYVQWASDSAEHQAKGSLDYFHAGPLLKVVRARSTAVYDGVTLVRTLVLLDGNVLDLYDVSSDKEHTYDYVLHVDGRPAIDPMTPMKPQEGPLGTKWGYQWLTNVRRVTTNDAFGISFTAKNQELLGMRLFPAPSTEIILADGITNKPTEKMPTFVARRKAKSTTYAAVFSLSRMATQVRPPQITCVGDRTFTTKNRSAKSETYLFLPKSAGEATWNKCSCFALAAAFQKSDRGFTADLVQAKHCSIGDLRIRLSAPTNLCLTASPNLLQIITGMDAEAKIAIEGVPAAQVRVQEVTSEGKRDVAWSKDRGAVSLDLRPLTAYEVRW